MMSKVLSCYLPHLTLHPPPHLHLQPEASNTGADSALLILQGRYSDLPLEALCALTGSACRAVVSFVCFCLKIFAVALGFGWVFLFVLLFVRSQKKMFELLLINIELWHSHLGSPQVSCAETPQLKVENFNTTCLHSQSNASP